VKGRSQRIDLGTHSKDHMGLPLNDLCNVGLAISTRVDAIVENTAPKRVFSNGVSLSPILCVKTACDRGVLVHAVSWGIKLSRDVNTIFAGALVSSQFMQ
jgi:hypothetical protein